MGDNRVSAFMFGSLPVVTFFADWRPSILFLYDDLGDYFTFFGVSGLLRPDASTIGQQRAEIDHTGEKNHFPKRASCPPTAYQRRAI
jgi:hypothetical protein